MQASKPLTSTSDILKIKEAFTTLNAKKIDQVNNIVHGQNKPKPRIKMTTKGPSRKHIIIPMSSKNISSFMKNSALNVANINRELWNAKTNVLVDYVCSDNMGIMIVTDKVAQQLDLSIIDHYIKNLNDINCYGTLGTWTIFIFFFFYFGRWRGTWHRSHMTCHIIWRHKAWKVVEGSGRWCQGTCIQHGGLEKEMRWTWGCSTDQM